MRKSTINILLYSIMGVLSISICVLLFKIATRPRYISVPEPANTIQEISFDVALGNPVQDSSNEYENPSDVADNNENNTVDTSSKKMGKASTKVNIRETDSADSRVLELVDEGYTFEIVEILDSGWVKIVYDNGYGYISAKYVILIN